MKKLPLLPLLLGALAAAAPTLPAQERSLAKPPMVESLEALEVPEGWIPASGWVVSADGAHAAVILAKGFESRVWLDGSLQAPFERIRPMPFWITPGSNLPLYVAENAGGVQLVHGTRAFPTVAGEIESITTSPDGQHVAYLARERKPTGEEIRGYLDGELLPRGEQIQAFSTGTFTWSPAGELADIVREGPLHNPYELKSTVLWGDREVAVQGNLGTRYLSTLTFDATGERLAFAGERFHISEGGQPGGKRTTAFLFGEGGLREFPVDQLDRHSVAFSPEGSLWYLAGHPMQAQLYREGEAVREGVFALGEILAGGRRLSFDAASGLPIVGTRVNQDSTRVIAGERELPVVQKFDAGSFLVSGGRVAYSHERKDALGRPHTVWSVDGKPSRPHQNGSKLVLSSDGAHHAFGFLDPQAPENERSLIWLDDAAHPLTLSGLTQNLQFITYMTPWPLAFSPDGSRLLGTFAGKQGAQVHYLVHTDEPGHGLPLGAGTAVRNARFSPDGAHVIYEASAQYTDADGRARHGYALGVDGSLGREAFENFVLPPRFTAPDTIEAIGHRRGPQGGIYFRYTARLDAAAALAQAEAGEEPAPEAPEGVVFHPHALSWAATAHAPSHSRPFGPPRASVTFGGIVPHRTEDARLVVDGDRILRLGEDGSLEVLEDAFPKDLRTEISGLPSWKAEETYEQIAKLRANQRTQLEGQGLLDDAGRGEAWMDPQRAPWDHFAVGLLGDTLAISGLDASQQPVYRILSGGRWIEPVHPVLPERFQQQILGTGFFERGLITTRRNKSNIPVLGLHDAFDGSRELGIEPHPYLTTHPFRGGGLAYTLLSPQKGADPLVRLGTVSPSGRPSEELRLEGPLALRVSHHAQGSLALVVNVGDTSLALSVYRLDPRGVHPIVEGQRYTLTDLRQTALERITRSVAMAQNVSQGTLELYENDRYLVYTDRQSLTKDADLLDLQAGRLLTGLLPHESAPGGPNLSLATGTTAVDPSGGSRNWRWLKTPIQVPRAVSARVDLSGRPKLVLEEHQVGTPEFWKHSLGHGLPGFPKLADLFWTQVALTQEGVWYSAPSAREVEGPSGESGYESTTSLVFVPHDHVDSGAVDASPAGFQGAAAAKAQEPAVVDAPADAPEDGPPQAEGPTPKPTKKPITKLPGID